MKSDLREWPRLEPRGLSSSNLGSNLLCTSLLVYSIGHTDKPWYSVQSDYTRCKYQEVGISGAILEAPKLIGLKQPPC